MQNLNQDIGSLLQNKKLFFIYTILQSIGINLTVSKMSIGESDYSMCSIKPLDIEKRIWSLAVENNICIPEDVVCHELIHLILFYEGFPAVGIPDWLNNTWDGDILRFLQNLVLHLEVWNLTEQYGFSEKARYTVDITNALIPQIENNTLSIGIFDFHARTLERASYIANGLLCPASEDVKQTLQKVASSTYPQEFELAKQIYQLCQSAMPLTPESCFRLLDQIVAPLRFPKGSIPIIYTEEKYLNLRAQLFAVSNGALDSV